MPSPTYLDYAATTPVDSRVIETMMKYLGVESCFANPASRSHMAGWQAEAAVEGARKQVAQALNADIREIVWTSGATEANNLAIKGVAELRRQQGKKGGHIITSSTEHKAVLDCVQYLETQGYRASYIKPGAGGIITKGMVENVLEQDTFLVSVMHVNNETGVVNDVEGIAELAAQRDFVYHMDAAQSAGKLPLDMSRLPVDLVSLCAHKIYGPKGVGALYVKRKPGFVLPAQIHGGGHERGMRSGTLATHQIAGLGECLQIAVEEMELARERAVEQRNAFLTALGRVEGLKLNGDQNNCAPNILNMSFEGVDGQFLLSALPTLAISSGSACTSAAMSPSHVLSAMGLSDELALSALRVSFGRYSDVDQAANAGKIIASAIKKLRR